MSHYPENAAVRAAMEQWNRVVESRDMALLADLAHPEVVFRSPMAHKPYHGAFALATALSTVIEVFEDFTYHRSFLSEDGLNLTLEFSAHIGDKALKGIDMIRFDKDGKIREFEVMIRPMSGLAALGEEMGRRVGAQLQTFK